MVNDVTWSDSPRDSADISGRPGFVAAVAARINETTQGTPSTVFGLVGPWGGGKTTLLRAIEDQIAGKVVWFSPWSAADEASITSEFVAAIAEAYPAAPDLKANLLRYARFGAPALGIIPYAGAAVKEAAEAVLDAVSPGRTWHAEFDSLSREIAGQGERLLVIVDDVDRLDTAELRVLLRVIRLLGRFDGVHYLLAYDQATIDQVLTEQGTPGKGSEYMEKIVQYPFEVPPVPGIVRRRWARDVITVALSQEDQNSTAYRDAVEKVIEILAAGIETPRAAGRLREQLLSFLGLAVGAELDPLDFVLVSWFRIAHHDVWDHIRTHMQDYLRWSDSDEDSVRQARRDALAPSIRRGNTDATWAAVLQLFEAPTSFNMTAVRGGRIRGRRYFDRYFQLGLAEDDVSDAKIASAVGLLTTEGQADSTVDLLTEILEGTDGERAALAIQIARDIRDESPSTDLVAYLKDRREALVMSGQLTDYRQAPFTQWFGREIILALALGDLATSVAIRDFGYQLLVESAIAVRQSGRRDYDLLKTGFRGVAEAWLSDIAQETLTALVERSEFYTMMTFCAWIGDDLGKDSLASKVLTADDLITLASRFIRNNVIYGPVNEYDLTFDGGTLIYALSREALNRVEPKLPERNPALEYETTDRELPNLSPEEQQDFIIRNLYELTIEWLPVDHSNTTQE